jgi:glycosyltransferase involved in cell wall biosynthesis
VVLKKGDLFFVHSQDDERRLRELVPSAAITHAFHPLYDFFNTGVLSKPEARTKLELQGNTILFFGFVRPYKGIDDLLRAMPMILKKTRVTLLVVGEFWEGREAFARQLKELNIEDAVRVVDRYVPNEQVGIYFSAADLVVLPYRSGTGSGIVQIAYGLEKPVLATRVGSLPEVVEDGITGYIVNPGDPQALADAVIRFFAEEQEATFVENIRRKRERFSWENLVALIELLPEGSKVTSNEPPSGSVLLPSLSRP